MHQINRIALINHVISVAGRLTMRARTKRPASVMMGAAGTGAPDRL
jgi:hypothetical protein